MFETRAQVLGLTGARSPRAMAARTQRQLSQIRERLEKVAGTYADIDNSLQVELDGLLAHFDEFAKAVDGTVEWLNEEAPYD